MKDFTITVPVRQLAYDELSDEDRRLVDAARRATDGALASYSHFRVGAAILLDNGETVSGANQENAAFPSSMCAERTAAYWAGANRPGRAMRKIAIAARTADDTFQRAPIAPCGACRQALLEYETLQRSPMQVLLYGADHTYIIPSVASLLPVTFTDFK